MGAFNTGPIIPNVNGRTSLSSQLYAPTDKLLVGPRRRALFPNVNVGPIAANATATNTSSVNLSDQLMAGDGFLFEFLMSGTSGAAGANQNLVTLQSLGVTISWIGGGGGNLPTSVVTTTLAPFSQGGAGGVLVINFIPSLWTSYDLNSVRGGGQIGLPLPIVVQPGQMQLTAAVFNGSAIAQTVSFNSPFLFYRMVRGLEEN